MPIDRKLLEILVCPVTKQSVKPLSEHRLACLNRAIGEGQIDNHAGEKLTEAMTECLVTANGETIYPIDEGIPVMLEDQSIATLHIADWPQ